MANEKHIPEDITLNILSRLPVKSLIRFVTVSKRWRFIILSDPQFARSHMEVACEQKTLGRRLLVPTYPQLESVDLETPSFGDTLSVRKLTFPSNQARGMVALLGSCNGLVCVKLEDDWQAWDPPITYYIWNPSTGLFQKLPDLVEAGSEQYHGFGYLSATNEYKVIIKNYNQVNIFSTRSHLWEKIQSPFQGEPLESRGVLLNEALHWIPNYYFDNSIDYFEQNIYAFDLAKEEFLKKPLPTDFLDHCGENWYYPFDGCHLGSFEGCLCVCRYDYPCDYIVLWVLREYNVCDSWTKLFKLRVSDQPAEFSPILIRGSRIVLVKYTDQGRRGLLIIDHEEDKLCGPYMLEYKNIRSSSVVEYEESLLWLEDYYDTGT